MTFQERYDREELDRAEDRRQAEGRARGSFFRCGDCGTMDGVEYWSRGQLDEAEEHGPIELQFYRDTRQEQDDGHCLYSLCSSCTGESPGWLEPLDDDEVEEWRDKGCMCRQCVPF